MFREWKASDSGSRKGVFVEDGVVCESKFLASKIRYVFVLKECDALRSSLVEFLRKGAYANENGNGGHTWNPVCRWLKGLNSGVLFSPEERAEILSPIAVVNLKKHDEGNISTDMGSLRDVACRDKKFLKKQFEIYAGETPAVFVCCGPGMFDIVVSDVMGEDTQSIDHGHRPVFKQIGNSYFLAFSHPNARKPGLAELFQSYVKAIVN